MKAVSLAFMLSLVLQTAWAGDCTVFLRDVRLDVPERCAPEGQLLEDRCEIRERQVYVRTEEGEWELWEKPRNPFNWSVYGMDPQMAYDLMNSCEYVRSQGYGVLAPTPSDRKPASRLP